MILLASLASGVITLGCSWFLIRKNRRLRTLRERSFLLLDAHLSRLHPRTNKEKCAGHVHNTELARKTNVLIQIK